MSLQREQIAAQREAIARQRAELGDENVTGAAPRPWRQNPSSGLPLTSLPASSTATTTATTTTTTRSIEWSRADVSGSTEFTFSNLYQSGEPQEAVKVTADAAFGALATWLSEQQRLVERAFEVRTA